MKHVPITLALAVAMLAAVTTCAHALERTPPGSFLKYRATSVAELTGQLSKQPDTLALYSRHFGVSGQELTAYFVNNLKLVSLKSPLKVQMWYIGKDGKAHVKSKLLPKGTTVFATQDNKPVLSWSCGNPVRTKLPIVEAAKKPDNAIAPVVDAASDEVIPSAVAQQDEPATTTQPDNNTDTLVAANPLEVVTTAAIVAPPTAAVAAAVPITVPTVVDAAAVPAVAMPPVISAGGGFGLGWLGALGGLAGLAVGLGGGGGSTPPPTPAPVPEPSTILAMAMGVAGIAGCTLRQLRVRR